MIHPACARQSERGFALAETLIAFAIIAAALGVTYEAIQTTARGTLQLRDQRHAVPVAQGLMDRVGTDIALAPGVIDGSTDGEAWRIEISPYREIEKRGTDGPALLEILVSVHPLESAQPLLVLRSLRVAA